MVHIPSPKVGRQHCTIYTHMYVHTIFPRPKKQCSTCKYTTFLSRMLLYNWDYLNVAQLSVCYSYCFMQKQPQGKNPTVHPMTSYFSPITLLNRIFRIWHLGSTSVETSGSERWSTSVLLGTMGLGWFSTTTGWFGPGRMTGWPSLNGAG